MEAWDGAGGERDGADDSFKLLVVFLGIFFTNELKILKQKFFLLWFQFFKESC